MADEPFKRVHKLDESLRNPVLVKIGNHALGDLIARLLEDHRFRGVLTVHEAQRLAELMDDLMYRADAAIDSCQ